MSDTYRWEHISDSYHTNYRDERKARQPQAPVNAFYADLSLDEESD